MPGLQQAVLNYGRKAMGIAGSLGERAGMGLTKYVGSAMANPFARRTSLGAIGGAIAGGIYGGMSSNGSVLGGALAGAGIGAAGARYGGTFMRAGMTPGMGIGYAGKMAMASGRGDFRRAVAMGRSSAGLIGRTITSGIGKIRGLGR